MVKLGLRNMLEKFLRGED